MILLDLRMNNHACICEVKGCGKCFARGEHLKRCEKHTH